MMRFLCIVSPYSKLPNIPRDDCFAALQLILSRFIGWRSRGRRDPTDTATGGGFPPMTVSLCCRLFLSHFSSAVGNCWVTCPP